MSDQFMRRSLAGNFTSIRKPKRTTNQAGGIPTPENAPTPQQESDHKADQASSSKGQPCNEDQTWDRILTTIQRLDNDLRDAFIEDANQCVDSIEHSLLDEQNETDSEDHQKVISRELHNLKGVSASVGLNDLSDLLHHLEESVSSNREQSTPHDKTSLYNAIDRIRKAITIDRREIQDGATHDPKEHHNPLRSLSGSEGMVSVEINKLNRLMDSLAQLVMLRNRRETEIQALQFLLQELPTTASKVRSLGTALTDANNLNDAALAADVANDLHEIHRKLHLRTRPLSDGNTAVTSFINDFRQELTSLRRTPLHGLSQRLHRAVVDAAKAEQKDVCFEFVGEQERLETHLQQRLIDALIHVARNAVCHGIEPPHHRTLTGKPRQGKVTVRVKASPESLLFEVSDDGRGLAFDSIQKTANQLGVSPHGVSLTREELARLILRPGFTTRDKVSSIAGRGIGLDVVASDLEKMRGWVDIESTEGSGTTIRLNVPIPSLIQHVVLFEHQGQCFGIPMRDVEETGKADDSLPTLTLGGSGTINTSKSLVINLKNFGGLDGEDSTCSQFNLDVDEIIGTEEMVIQPLPEILRSHPYITGVTLSGKGESVLILSPPDLQKWFNPNCQPRQGNGDSKFETASEKECRSVNPTTDSFVDHEEQQATPNVALILSDSISSRARLKECLGESDYQIREFRHYKEAATFASSNSVDLIIFDDRSRINHFMDLVTRSSDPSSLESLRFLFLGTTPLKQLPNGISPNSQVKHVMKPISPDAISLALDSFEPQACRAASATPKTDGK